VQFHDPTPVQSTHVRESIEGADSIERDFDQGPQYYIGLPKLADGDDCLRESEKKTSPPRKRPLAGATVPVCTDGV
jgi:hypothetical protein